MVSQEKEVGVAFHGSTENQIKFDSCDRHDITD